MSAPAQTPQTATTTQRPTPLVMPTKRTLTAQPLSAEALADLEKLEQLEAAAAQQS